MPALSVSAEAAAPAASRQPTSDWEQHKSGSTTAPVASAAAAYHSDGFDAATDRSAQPPLHPLAGPVATGAAADCSCEHPASIRASVVYLNAIGVRSGEHRSSASAIAACTSGIVRRIAATANDASGQATRRRGTVIFGRETAARRDATGGDTRENVGDARENPNYSREIARYIRANSVVRGTYTSSSPLSMMPPSGAAPWPRSAATSAQNPPPTP